MHVLGISGSPKIKGFTNLLLDKALDGARAGRALTHKIILNDLDFKPCQECDGCKNNGICVQEDGMRVVYEGMKSADAIIIASPIYFGTVTAQLKAMIDRCNSLWVSRLRLNNETMPEPAQKGAFICIAGKEKNAYFKDAKSVISIFFSALGISYAGELFVYGLDKETDASPKKRDALLKSYELGQSLFEAASHI